MLYRNHIPRRRAPWQPELLEQRVCLSTVFAAAPVPSLDLAYVPFAQVTGNFDGASKPDLAVVNLMGSSSTLNVLLGTGDGGFTAAPTPPIPVGYAASGAAGDFGNGHLDLAYANGEGTISSNGEVEVFLGDGAGGFTGAPGSPITVGDAPTSVLAGDLTGNGRSDLVVDNSSSENISVLLSEGNGTFVDAPASPITFPETVAINAIALGDFNNDGKLDVAVAYASFKNGQRDNLQVLWGQGDGQFIAGPISTFPGRPGDVESMAVGDFSGDGLLDIAAADLANNDVYVMLNKGDGRFSPAASYPISFPGLAPELSAADFTGNGRQDLAVTAGGITTVLLSNRDGSFSNAPGSPFSGSLVAAGDFDSSQNDEPDLAVINAEDQLGVLLNTSAAGLPTGTLGANLAAGVPSAVVAGTTDGTATVTVAARSGQAVNGPVSVSLFTSPDLSLFDATQVTATITKNVRLKPGASKTLRFPISLFASAPAGTYHLIAAVDAPDGSTTAVAGPMITITKPLVSTIAANLTGSPASVPPGGKLSFSLTLQNAGNVPVSGSAGLTISLSSSASGTSATPAATMPLRVKLKVGQSSRSRLRVIVPKDVAAGSYYIVASLDVGALGDVNAADGMAVSAVPIVVR